MYQLPVIELKSARVPLEDSKLACDLKCTQHVNNNVNNITSIDKCVAIRMSPVTSRLTGSFVPDLIVSMSHQMWLHLQSDESVGSIGFKINYKGTPTDGISAYFCHAWICLIQRSDAFTAPSVRLSALPALPEISPPPSRARTPFTWTFRDNVTEGSEG